MTPAHYQTLEYSRVDRLFRAYVESAPGPLRVLDFGCGRGRYLKALSSLGCEVAGVDANPDYVEEAKAAGFPAWLPDGFFEQDQARFDVILLSHLVEHLTPEELVGLIPKLCRLAPGGRLIIITPLHGERFWHDFSHLRPYYPQSIRHAFGQLASPLSFGGSTILELEDIYFFADPLRTRTWRSFYVKRGLRHRLTSALNGLFDAAWRLSGGRIGIKSSWLGVYRIGASPGS
jgi:SAM-dependent methyltransferase